MRFKVIELHGITYIYDRMTRRVYRLDDGEGYPILTVIDEKELLNCSIREFLEG